jgi:DNA repair exonuclease SbcCD ATPase subunit
MSLQPYRDFFYDNTGYYGYVLVNATADELEHIKNALVQNGITVSHSGKSYRPPNTRNPLARGRQYDWFLRVHTENGEKPPLGIIDLVKGIQLEKSDPIATRAEEFQRQLEESREKFRKEIEERDQRLEAINRERENVSEEKSSLEQEIDFLRSKLGIQDEAIKSLTEQIDEERETLAAFSDDLRVAENAKAIAESKLEQLKHDKTSAPETVASENHPDATALGEVLQVVFPDVEFIKGSLEVLETEIQDVIPVLQKIHAITYLNEQGKPVQVTHQKAGCLKWYELRFSTGMSDDGRIYFTYKEKEKPQNKKNGKQQSKDDGKQLNQKRQILISWKQMQDSDFDYLANHT